MQQYKVVVSERAKKQIKKLPREIAQRLVIAISGLKENPRPSGCKKLKGRNAYRIRKGDYRVIYTIEDDVLIVTVINIGHRSDVYD